MGDPKILCKVLKMAMLHVFVAALSLCPLSNLRNVHIKCHYDLYGSVITDMSLRPHVACHI